MRKRRLGYEYLVYSNYSTFWEKKECRGAVNDSGLTCGLHMLDPRQHAVSGPHRQFNVDCGDLDLT